MKISFAPDKIDIKNYIFPISAARRNFTITPNEIKEVRLERFPPEVMLQDGEIIFLDAAAKALLDQFASTHGLLKAARLDVWSFLCEPYLDTQFTPEQNAFNMQTLSEAGFNPDEVAAIRDKIKAKMLFFNSMAWEWVNLSQYDVLTAFGFRNRFFNILFSQSRQKFYAWCNQISNRAPYLKA